MLEHIDRLMTFEHKQSVCIAISEEVHVGAARRQALAIAEKNQVNSSDANKIALIINELGSNLIKHAVKNKPKQLLFNYVERQDNKVFQIIACDKGPGIANLTQCLKDGYSTTNTAGTGLGAVQRLANYFNVYSLLDRGTVVLAEIIIHDNKKAASTSDFKVAFDVAGLCLPKPSEKMSGDYWDYYQSDNYCLVIVADGLGHGPEAAEASHLACEIFRKAINLSPSRILHAIDQALSKTRGAAVSIALIDTQQQQVIYAGLGNVSGCIYSNSGLHHMVNQDGTAGFCQRNIQEYRYKWDTNATLIMHSDGLMSRWAFDPYPGLITRAPVIIASVLCRDFTRGNDDMNIVIVKNNLSVLSNGPSL